MVKLLELVIKIYEIFIIFAGGLTENDFILAAKIDKLPLESYLRRK